MTLCSRLCETLCCLHDGVHGSAARVPDSATEEERLEAAYVMGARLDAADPANSSAVHEASCRRSGRPVRLKLVEHTGVDADRELRVLQRVGSHRHVASLLSSYELRRHLALVLERPSGGEVLEVLAARGPFSERDASHLVRQLAAALEHLQQLGVAHRNVQPDRLRHESDVAGAPLKLCDFSMAVVGQKGPAGTASRGASSAVAAAIDGTAGFMSPEVLRGEAHGPPTDAWNLGVFTYILLAGRHPFDVDGRGSDSAVNARVLRGQWGFAGEPAACYVCWRHVSAEARQATRLLLEDAPERRLTAAQLLQGGWLQTVRRGVATPMPGAERQLEAFNRARRQRSASVRMARQVAANCALSPPAAGAAGSGSPRQQLRGCRPASPALLG